MAEKPNEQVEMAPDPEEDDLDDLDGMSALKRLYLEVV